MARSSELTRRLDRLVGKTVAATIGPLHRRRPMPHEPRRIAVIQPTAIGDTLIGSGCVAALARRFPDAELIVAHGPSNAAAVRMLAAPVRAVEIRFANPAKGAWHLRKLQPDMIVDLTPWPYATAMAARLSAAWSAGFVPDGSRRGRLFDLAVPHRTDRHEIENLMAMAEALDADVGRHMAIRREPSARPTDLDPHGLVLCHVSAGGARAAAKSWPVAHWVALVHGLVGRGYRVGFTGAPADLPAAASILGQAGLPQDRAFSLCGRLSLAALAELLAEVPLLVSVDTGVLHLSAAVDGCAIGLHGPTKAARWGAVSVRARGLDAPHPAGGYILYGWEDHPAELDIMSTLAPERVLAAADEMLAPQLLRA